MERFKIKNSIFLIFAIIFVSIFFRPQKIDASSNYTVEIERVDGLVYGNKHSTGQIVVKTQSIPGTFKYAFPNDIAHKTGQITIAVDFVPLDEKYMGMRLFPKADVGRRPINIVFNSSIYKQYDGTDKVDLPEYIYDGILEGDDVSVVGELSVKYSGTYISEEVPLEISGISLEGSKKDYYSLSLDNYFGRIHPSSIKDVSNNVSIGFDKNVFVDIKSSVSVQNKEKVYSVNDEYTSFLEYEFIVYDHNGKPSNVEGRYNVSLKVDNSKFSKERLEIFEKTSDNKFIKLNYTYNDGVMRFEIDSDSQIVFTTRDIEYHFILIFSGIILFSAIYAIAYRLVSRKVEDDEEER